MRQINGHGSAGDIGQMDIQNFDVAVGEIIPKLDGKSAMHMNLHPPPAGIAFDKIRKR